MGERAFLNRLGGGCQVPVAGYGSLKDQTFTITGMVCSLDGKTMIKKSLSGPAVESENTGIELAELLLSLGADRIIKNLTNF
jgi:hydroxymethylbilane synthase